MFMDADDWAEPQMLTDMVQFAEEHSLELVVSGFYIDTYYGKADEHTVEVKSCPTRVFGDQREFRATAWRLFDANQLYPPWNKLFLRSRVEDIDLRFRPTFWDDFPSCSTTFATSRRSACLRVRTTTSSVSAASPRLPAGALTCTRSARRSTVGCLTSTATGASMAIPRAWR